MTTKETIIREAVEEFDWEVRIKDFIEDFNSCVEPEERGDTVWGLVSDIQEHIYKVYDAAREEERKRMADILRRRYIGQHIEASSYENMLNMIYMREHPHTPISFGSDICICGEDLRHSVHPSTPPNTN